MFKENIPELKKSNVWEWHEAGYKGRGITIVVLDDKAFPIESDDIEEPIQDNVPYKNKKGPTHKALVCSVLRIVAPEARIVAFSWFGSKKEEIVKWIHDHRDEVAIINCSFGGTVSKDEFAKLESLDIPIICSSGNGGKIGRIGHPASLPYTMAIGAWQEWNDKKANYSDGGKELDAMAYTGLQVPKMDKRDKAGRAFAGTSCAAPFVCGMMACYYSYLVATNKPILKREATRAFIRENSVDKYEPGFDMKSGYGLFVMPKLK